MSGQDDRVVTISMDGYQSLVKPDNGRNLHWTTDVKQELPVKLYNQGIGSIAPKTILESFGETVKKFPNKPCMFVEKNGKILQWNWTEYWRDCRSFAKAMHKLNITERSAVAVMGFNSPEWVISFYGGIMYNCVNTGIYITNEAEACVYQSDHAEAEVVIVETAAMLDKFVSNLDKLPRVKAIVVYGEDKVTVNDKRVYMWSDFMKLGSDVSEKIIDEKIQKQVPGQCCCLIYTSGTTGRPKGCMLSHDNLQWDTMSVLETLRERLQDYKPEDQRVVSYLPLSHIAGLCFDVISHSIAGGEVYFARPDALQGTLVQTLSWARPTLFFAVPRVWEKFEDKLKEIAAEKPQILQNISGWAKGYGTSATEARMRGEEPPTMYSVAHFLILNKIKQALGLDQAQFFFFGAAPMKPVTMNYFASLSMPVYGLYGMSETTGATTIMTHHKFRLDSAGYCLPGTDLKIANPDDKGEGEICMRGRNTMMGYLKNEKATAETIDEQGFIHSGDKGKIDEHGFLRITGRIKELIITAGGENVAPVPIEDNFKAVCPPCSNIMVVGEGQRFMAALITFKVDIDPKSGAPGQGLMPECVAFFKKELGIDIKTADEACNSPEVAKYIQKCLEETNKMTVSRAAHLRKYKLVPVDFSIPGGELTPTLKLKRKVTENKYINLVQEMFAQTAKL